MGSAAWSLAILCSDGQAANMKALILGDQRRLTASIGRALRLRWPEVDLAVEETVGGARRELDDDPPDVLFVSSTLSGTDALAFVREIGTDSEAVVMFVGSRSDEADTVEALEAGADDYISTPISESLLVAKVCAALRRVKRFAPEEVQALKCGDLVIDPQTHEAHLKGKPLYLTPTEFKLLYHLAQHQGRVVTQHALEAVVWGSSDRLYVDVLRKHVQRLRRKLQTRRSHRTTISTVPRVGYKLVQKNTERSGVR